MKASNFDLMKWNDKGYPLLCCRIIDETANKMCLNELNQIPGHHLRSHSGKECENPIAWSVDHCKDCCISATEETKFYRFEKRPRTFYDDVICDNEGNYGICARGTSEENMCKNKYHECSAPGIYFIHCQAHCWFNEDSS